MTLLTLLLSLLAGVVFVLWLFTYFTVRKVEAALKPEGRFVQVRGIKLHVVEAGQGPTVLLIHGLSGQLKNFSYSVLGELAKTYRVVALDRPGSGYSESAADATLDTQADIVSALIDELGLGQPLVVGHSLGGAVALALALRHPKQVAGLALIAPLTHLVESPPKVFRALTISQDWLRHLVAWTLLLPMMIAGRKETLEIVFGPENCPKDFPTKGGGLLGLRPSHFVAASRDLNAIPLTLPTQQAQYAALTVPVSILYGRQDRVLNPTLQGAAFANVVPGTELQWVEGGHMLPVTQPAVTVQFIQNAMARHAALLPSEV